MFAIASIKYAGKQLDIILERTEEIVEMETEKITCIISCLLMLSSEGKQGVTFSCQPFSFL